MVLIGKGRLGENDKLQGSILTLHEYYTNYDINNKSAKFDVTPAKTLKVQVNPDSLGPSWWKFKTNIEPDDFAFQMSEAQVKSFLNRMWEIYRHRKAI